jgi:hypothetical protein
MYQISCTITLQEELKLQFTVDPATLILKRKEQVFLQIMNGFSDLNCLHYSKWMLLLEHRLQGQNMLNQQ